MKNVTVKKVLGLSLTLVMLLSAFTGCGSQEPETSTEETGQSSVEGSSEAKDSSQEEQQEVVELEPVTLKMNIPGAEAEGTADVLAAFNEKLAEVLPNTTLEIEFGGGRGDYGATWSMLMAGNEVVDLAWAGYTTPFEQDVKDGTILSISPYISEETTPNLVKEMETYTSDWATCLYEGEYYGVPSTQPSASESMSLHYSPKLDPYLDLDALLNELRNNQKCTEELLDIIEETIQAAIDAGDLKVGDLSWHINELFFDIGLIGYLGAGNRTYIDAESKDAKVMYLWEIPEVQMCYERAAKWYDMGWITETQVIKQMPEGSERIVWFNAAYNQNWGNVDEMGILRDSAANYNNNIKENKILVSEPLNGYVDRAKFGGCDTYMVVPFTSENPERAVMLLDVLHGEPGTVGNELYRMLCYGFESNSPEAKKYGWSNYTAVEADGLMKRDTSVLNGADAKHSITDWQMGNTYKGLFSVDDKNNTAETIEYCDYYWNEIHPNKKRTVISGMIINYEDWTDDIASFNTVYSEYNNQLIFGGGGSAKLQQVLDAALKKLYDSGFQAYKEDIEAQIVEYNK